MTKPYIDVGIIVPLKEEFRRLENLFISRSEAVHGVTFAKEFDLAEGLKGVAFLQDDMGKAAATRATDLLLFNYDVGIIVVIGIAGGIGNNVSIGDVCFSGTIIDVLENAKVSDGKHGTRIEFNTKFYATDSRLTFALSYCDLGADMKARFESWQLEQHYLGKALVPGQFIGRENLNEELAIPSIHDGNIVCGAVSKSDIYNSQLKLIERKVLALETEAGGVFHSAKLQNVPAISIRGICDYADENKNKLEVQTQGKTREIAANNAFSFFKLQFSNPNFLSFLADRRMLITSSTAPLLEDAGIQSVSALAIEQSKDEVHEHLTRLSPQYHGKPKGYRLPVPRVRRSPLMATVSPTLLSSDPFNVLEAIAAHRIVAIDVPRNYPDNGLPWIIAAELGSVKIDGKQALPLVMRGDAIRPPQGSLQKQSEYDLQELSSSEFVRPVIILEDFPSNSKSRSEYFREEMQKYPEMRFVIVNRVNPNITTDSFLITATGAEQLDVVDISFAEMTGFFQRTFQLEDQEAGVVALKLRDMFRTFKLEAHPSYFAGVANEVLMALLRANRRAELLQLAVDGILSFVVATDCNDVVLSRTTREEVLRKLVFEKRIKGSKFDRSGFVKFVQTLSDNKDWGIDPISFVSAFQEKGIIHFDSDGVQISLPFIEAFLLANELVRRPGDAANFFDLNRSDFDFATFDIYSELGPAEEVVDAVLAALDESLSQVAMPSDRPHVLLTDEVKPQIFQNRARLQAIENMIGKAFEDVVHSRPNSAEKQRLLDVAAKVEGEAKEAQESARLRHQQQTNSPTSEIEKPIRVFGAGALLLGSASERLDKGPKRSLSEKIVALTSCLLDQLLRKFPTVQFEGLRSEMLSEEAIRTSFKLTDEQIVEEKHTYFIGALIDAYEFSLLGYPLRAMLECLGNAAGQAVLRTSVASLDPPGKVETVIARVWAAEIDAEQGKAALVKSLAGLPDVQFLRYTLSQYLMTRVFWNHWELRNRLALLEAARVAVQPFQQIDTGRIERTLENQN